MKKLLIVSVLGVLVLSACSSAGPRGTTGQTVHLLPRGSLRANAYAIAYETCGQAGIDTVARDVRIPVTEATTVASAYVRATFSARAAGFARRGCEDAFEGRAAALPAARSSR